jgi:hypothetical protein
MMMATIQPTPAFPIADLLEGNLRLCTAQMADD